MPLRGTIIGPKENGRRGGLQPVRSPADPIALEAALIGHSPAGFRAGRRLPILGNPERAVTSAPAAGQFGSAVGPPRPVCRDNMRQIRLSSGMAQRHRQQALQSPRAARSMPCSTAMAWSSGCGRGGARPERLSRKARGPTTCGAPTSRASSSSATAAIATRSPSPTMPRATCFCARRWSRSARRRRSPPSSSCFGARPARRDPLG